MMICFYQNKFLRMYFSKIMETFFYLLFTRSNAGWLCPLFYCSLSTYSLWIMARLFYIITIDITVKLNDKKQRYHNVVVDIVTTLWHGQKWEMYWRRFPTLWHRRSATLWRRCHNVSTRFSIGFLGQFTTCYSDFFPFIETWESYQSAKWY